MLVCTCTYPCLLKRFVVPVSTRIHSEDGIVDAAKIVGQGQFGFVPLVPARTRFVNLEHSAVGIVYHLSIRV